MKINVKLLSILVTLSFFNFINSSVWDEIGSSMSDVSKTVFKKHPTHKLSPAELKARREKSAFHRCVDGCVNKMKESKNR